MLIIVEKFFKPLLAFEFTSRILAEKKNLLFSSDEKVFQNIAEEKNLFSCHLVPS